MLNIYSLDWVLLEYKISCSDFPCDESCYPFTNIFKQSDEIEDVKLPKKKKTELKTCIYFISKFF